MKQRDKDLLLKLLSELDEDGLLNIYDDEENYHEIEWMFFDMNELCIKIK